MSLRALLKKCCCPVYADMVSHRLAALSIAGLGAAQLIGSTFGAGLPCPFHATTGLPCPGCGLTRSVLALLRGNIDTSFYYHPFGPLLLVGLLTALVAGLLPVSLRRRLIAAIAVFERNTGFTAVVLTLLMMTWTLRVFGLLPLTKL